VISWDCRPVHIKRTERTERKTVRIVIGLNESQIYVWKVKAKLKIVESE
jgi:translation initiation factor 1 (eIF-1/SUI1)